MTTIRRLTDSCLLVTTDSDATLFDPGFHTFGSGEVDLESIGDVTRIFITHEHADHVNAEFVSWLIDRGRDLIVYSNEAVKALLGGHDIDVATGLPGGTSAEDVLHAKIPNGSTPPNRAFTIDGVLTHPGDSWQPTHSAGVLALPLMVPWGSTTEAMEFARRLQPDQVVPVHDFYLTESGNSWITAMAAKVLRGDGIELVPLGWGDSYTI